LWRQPATVKHDDLEAVAEGLRRAGYRPFYFDSILDQDIYFAGSVERGRANWKPCFTREGREGHCLRAGGYGSKLSAGST